MKYTNSDILTTTQSNDCSILIVCNTPLTSELISVNLENLDYQTSTTDNGIQALELIAANNFDLILLATEISDLNGSEVLERIRFDKNTIELPVIMLTTNNDKQAIAKSLVVGANDYVSTPLDIPVVIARIKTHLALKFLAEQLQQKNNLLQEMSIIDDLTAIPNRRYLNQYLEQEWQRAIRHKTLIAIIFVEVDYFEFYNETYGNQDGDNCLKKISLALNTTIKRKTDLVARYGEKEFIVVLPDTNLEQSVKIAESIRSSIEMLNINNETSEISNHITISGGVMTHSPQIRDHAQSLIDKAYNNLSLAKKQGKNRIIS